MKLKKVFLLALGLLIALLSAGCFDLFAIPGVALSPDGSQIYFLSSGSDPGLQAGIASLSSLDVKSGKATVITSGSEQDFTTAFAVNPTNGDLAYVQTSAAKGTQIMLTSGGKTRELVPASAFTGFGVGTMMRYSPDGSQIALSLVLFPPDINPDVLSPDSLNIQVDRLAGTHFVLYVIKASDGTLTQVSDLDKEKVNTMDWSPSGKWLVYNAWRDNNDDGKVSTWPNIDPNTMSTDVGDRSQIRIYDLAAGKTTSVDSQTLDYAPTFISENQIAYVALDFSTIVTGSTPDLMIYDLSDKSSHSAYTSSGLITGLALSPDGKQVAWIESGAAQPTTGDTPPTHLFISGTDFQNPRSVLEIPGDQGIPDIPVWTPDGKALLLSSTNVVASFAQQFAGIGAGSADLTVGRQQKLVRIDVGDGTSTTLYEGQMTNSSYFSSIFGLITSGALDQLNGLTNTNPGESTPEPTSTPQSA